MNLKIIGHYLFFWAFCTFLQLTFCLGPIGLFCKASKVGHKFWELLPEYFLVCGLISLILPIFDYFNGELK